MMDCFPRHVKRKVDRYRPTLDSLTEAEFEGSVSRQGTGVLQQLGLCLRTTLTVAGGSQRQPAIRRPSPLLTSVTEENFDCD